LSIAFGFDLYRLRLKFKFPSQKVMSLDNKTKVKLFCALFFLGLAVTTLVTNNRFVTTSHAFSSGPPAGVTGAPGESACFACHADETHNGQFSIVAPQTYMPGQTYQITVQHGNSDASRRRWGFEMTALANNAPAGNLQSANSSTQVITGGPGGSRQYIEHTSVGTFQNQTGGASWTFNWTAPASNVGPVTLYAAGNQADNSGNTSGDQIYLTSVTLQPQQAPMTDKVADFDGDGKTDLSIFRPSNGQWWLNFSSDGIARVYTFGTSTDKIVPADYDGDGKTDVAFWRPSTGEWFVLRSSNLTFFAAPFGASGDIPAPGDFDADGLADFTVFRPSTGTWFINQTTGGIAFVPFGVSGDVPTVGDYDGDGKSDVAIFRPSNGSWWMSRSTTGFFATVFGSGTDKPVQGDYTGDGKTDIAFWRPSTGEWYVLRSEDLSFYAAPFGTNGDTPAPGDYDGDNKTDLAVFRPSNTTWFVQRSTQGTLIQGFGLQGDIPTPSAFIPE
jgi:hypothetical protein